ncbi:MAG TPA: hypothetical protein VFU48_09120 [Nitrospira sp.]|nr:hypothetical protein [Nitrospira sp.]
MQTDMVSEILAACDEFRRLGQINKPTREVIGGLFGCNHNHPKFFYLVAALMGQFDLLEKQVSRSTRLNDTEKSQALAQIRGLSSFLQVDRLVRPWSDSYQHAFKQENFGIQFLRPTLSAEFPIQSLSASEIAETRPKIVEAIKAVKRSGAPEIVIKTLADCLDAVLEVMDHFRFYGVSPLTDKIVVAFATAEIFDDPSHDTPTRNAASQSILGIAALAVALLTQGNDAIHAVQDWSKRAHTVIEYIASNAPRPMLPPPEGTIPEEIESGKIRLTEEKIEKAQ